MIKLQHINGYIIEVNESEYQVYKDSPSWKIYVKPKYVGTISEEQQEKVNNTFGKRKVKTPKLSKEFTDNLIK